MGSVVLYLLGAVMMGLILNFVEAWDKSRVGAKVIWTVLWPCVSIIWTVEYLSMLVRSKRRGVSVKEYITLSEGTAKMDDYIKWMEDLQDD